MSSLISFSYKKRRAASLRFCICYGLREQGVGHQPFAASAALDKCLLRIYGFIKKEISSWVAMTHQMMGSHQITAL